MIPVNKEGMRIDTFLHKPTTDEFNAFKRRIHTHKLCNDFQLAKFCSQEDCSYDHSYLDPELLNVLKIVAREIPCARKGACRRSMCYKGHLCARTGCKSCKLGYRMHGVDTTVVDWVKPEDWVGGRDEEGSPDGVRLERMEETMQSYGALLSYEEDLD